MFLVRGHPSAFKVWPDEDQVKTSSSANFIGAEVLFAKALFCIHIQKAQEASRVVPMNEEESNVEVQARCRLWLRYSTSIMS
eukprot:scaffold147980_cov22-Tisochrysis_lutea.AAC.1